MKGFLRTQANYLWRTLPYRRTAQHKLWTLVQAVQLLAGYVRLKLALRFGTSSQPIPEKTCVVVLLTHHRPQNMWLVAESALRNEFITRVIVSNSNPEVKIRDWISSTDSRLSLIDEPGLTQPGHRLVLAKATEEEYFLSIDDDIFLTPKQWRNLFESLIANEHCPHGIIGQTYRSGTKSSNGSPFYHVAGRETQVDVLIGAYAFTREHLNCVFDLAANIGISDLSQVRNGEDILLSFAGTTQPHIHAIRPALFCASDGLPGVALWKTEHEFWQSRIRMFERVRDARVAMERPWADANEHSQTQRPRMCSI